MEKKQNIPKGYHQRKGCVAKNPTRYKPLGQRFDEKMEKSLKKSGLW